MQKDSTCDLRRSVDNLWTHGARHAGHGGKWGIAEDVLKERLRCNSVGSSSLGHLGQLSPVSGGDLL